MKKILIAMKNMNIGGVEKSLISLLNQMDPQKYEVDLLLLEDYGGFMDYIPSWVNIIICKDYCLFKDEVNLPPLSVVINHFKKGNIMRAVSLAAGYLKTKITNNSIYYYKTVFKKVAVLEKKYDIAVSYTSIISYLNWYVIYHVKADKKIGWIHFEIDKMVSPNNSFFLYLHKNLNKIYIVTEQSYNIFINQFPELKHLCEVKHIFIDKSTIERQSETGPTFTDYFDGVRIFTIGRLTWQKGIDAAVEICRRLKDSGFNIRWYDCGEGSQREVFEKLIEENNLKQDFVLLGNQQNPYGYLKDCDLYVQPSRYEGYCIAVNEARIFSKPIIATDFAGARDQLVDGVTGWIVPFDKNAIYDKIVWCITHKDEVAKVCRELSETSVCQKEEIDKIFDF